MTKYKMQMKRLTLALCAAILACACAWADGGFADETITYKVMFKWGLINKRAGTVKMSLRNDGDLYQCMLAASTASWADDFYKVRDTLTCTIRKAGFEPVIYEKRSHEDQMYEHNIVSYFREGGVTKANCSTYRTKKGKVKRDEKKVLEGEGVTLDMFSAYYYMRNLPYQDWSPGHTYKMNVFSGREKELLTIKYHGIEQITFDDKTYDCYRITFLFTSDGKNKSSDDMLAWITTGKERLPVKLEGKLPVGSIKCFITNK